MTTPLTPDFTTAYPRPEHFSPEEWAARVQLAAAYRIADHLGWTELIRSHPRVTLLTATAENRDAMPQTIAALIAKGDSHA